MVDSPGQVKKSVFPPFGRMLLALAFAVVFVLGLAPEGARAARLFTSGFETNNFTETEWDVTNGSPAIVTAPVHSGNYTLRVNPSAAAHWVYRFHPSGTTSGTFYVRYYVRFATFPGVNGSIISQITTNTGTDFSTAEIITVSGNKRIRLTANQRGSSTDSTFNLAADIWYRVEVTHAWENPATITLKLFTGDSGTEEFTLTISGVNGGGGNDIGRFYFGQITSDTSDIRFDDIAVNNSTGSFQNSLPGPGKVVLVKPTFDKSVQWTPNPAGSNAANVDDEPGTPDDDTTRNEVSDTTSQDKFHLSDLPTVMPPTATLTLAHVFARAGSNQAVADTIRLLWWNEEDTQITGPSFSVAVNGYRTGATNELLVVGLSTSTRWEVTKSKIGYTADTGTSFLKKVTALWANVEYTGEIPGGTEVSSRSDMLADSRPSASSNHTISFRTNNAITASSTVEIRFPADFSFPSGLDCGDVDAATSVQFILSTTSVGCEVTATNWGVSFAPSPPTLILTAPTSTGVYVATGTVVTIKIGSNATVQQQGDSWITNPSAGGTYTISVGGTFGGSGNMLVSILSGVTVEARVAEHLTVAITGVPNWYNSSWGYRKRITVNASSVSGTQAHVNFPMLLNSTDPKLRHTAWGGNVGSVTGFDFVFTAADGTTKLDHEIEKYASTTGEVVAWTRIPFLSRTSDTTLFLYYGNASASDQQNKTGVWDSNYKGVWHMTTTSTQTTLTFDSTALSNTGTKLTATDPNSVSSGQINGAQDFDGANDYVTMGDIDALDGIGAETLSAWVKTNATNPAEGLDQIVGKWSTAGSDGLVFVISGGQGIDDVLWGGWGGNTYLETTGNILPVNTWTYIVGVFDGSGVGNAGRLKLYANGVGASVVFASSVPAITPNTSFVFRAGADAEGGRLFPGTIDEARVSNAARSASWIATEYNNQSNPSAFYTLGGEQPIAQTSCVADDGATVSVVNTTETQVDFGTISANTFYQGCQDIEVSTNAGGGYSGTVQEQAKLKTGSGSTISDTTCDAGTCTEITAAAWTNPANVGFGHTCRNQTNNDCVSGYSNGTNFRQFADISAGETAQNFMTSSTPVRIAVGRVKYRLSVPSSQAAGTYTTKIIYIITPTY